MVQIYSKKMVGASDEIEQPQFIVPQNSASNFTDKMPHSSGISPLDTTFNEMYGAGNATCLHCENMAKNFLYLESLIRTNYNPKVQCNLCYSSLKYLQYVNKSIMQVFGKFESIMHAAKVFASAEKRRFPITDGRNFLLQRKNRLKAGCGITNLTDIPDVKAQTDGKPKSISVNKRKLTKKRSFGTKLSKRISTKRLTGGKSRHNLIIRTVIKKKVAPKTEKKSAAKNLKAAIPKISVMQKAEGSFAKGIKTNKTKKIKAVKVLKTHKSIKTLKPIKSLKNIKSLKCIKTKMTKTATTKLRAKAKAKAKA